MTENEGATSPSVEAEDRTLSDEQRQVVSTVAEWFYGRSDDLMTVGGYAGTGKTTVANQIPELLELERSRVAFCSFTGKAASRLRGGMTIHRLIYHPVAHHDPKCALETGEDDMARCSGLKGCGIRFEKVPSINYDLVIVDESSMINARIFEDLTSFGVPVLWVGDHGQLPPVKGEFNLMDNPILLLEEIHRQEHGSSIIEVALHARQYGRIPFGPLGDSAYKHRVVGEGLDLPDGFETKLLLCGKNRTRAFVNRAARRVLGLPEDQPTLGDRVVCLRNDYDVQVFNGMTGVIVSEPKFVAKENAFEIEVDVDGREATVNVLADAEQFYAQKTVPFPPQGIGLWDYAYALTVHKAQGSEADDVILLEEKLWGVDHARWLYTGVTRAKRTLEIFSRR